MAFVDVPGHERFVRNMLAGVGGIDLVLLVVAADESVMPQTREHFDICRLLRVPRGIIALTKSDLVDAETLDLVRLEVRELVDHSFLAAAPVVPVSVRTGEGLDDLRVALRKAGAESSGRSAAGATRLPVDRVFSMKGFGTVVTGTLVSGRVAQDDDLRVVPGDRRVKVRGLQVHGTSRSEAVAGERVALNLGGVAVDALHRGQSLTAPDATVETRIVDAVVDVLPDARPIAHAARVRFHQGTAELLARVAVVGPVEQPGEERSRRALGPGTRGYVRLRLEQPAALVRGDRFIIRSYSPPRTIAGGAVLDPLPPPRTAIRSDKALERCRRLDEEADGSGEADGSDAPTRAARVFLDEAGLLGLPISHLIARAGMPPERLSQHVRALVAGGHAVEIDGRLVSAPLLARLEADLMAALAEHHRRHPLSEGLAREEARTRLCGRGHPSVFERAVEDLAASGAAVARDRLSLPTHHVEWPTAAAEARGAIERLIRDGGLTPLDPGALAASSGVPPEVVDQVIRLLQRDKVVVKIETLPFHADALERLKIDMYAMKDAGAGVIDVPAFKERFGVTRKFAIPLLEYLDRERVTRRTGDVRVIL